MRYYWYTLALGALLTAKACAQAGTPIDSERLTPIAKKALQAALISEPGEYAAVALYAKVIEKHGKVEPFTLLLEAKVRHRSAVQDLLRRFRVPYPANPYLKKLKAPASLKQAGLTGILLAEASLAMYDKLLPDVIHSERISKTFKAIQQDTRVNLLPRLKELLERDGAAPGKRPRGPRMPQTPHRANAPLGGMR